MASIDTNAHQRSVRYTCVRREVARTQMVILRLAPHARTRRSVLSAVCAGVGHSSLHAPTDVRRLHCSECRRSMLPCRRCARRREGEVHEAALPQCGTRADVRVECARQANVRGTLSRSGEWCSTLSARMMVVRRVGRSSACALHGALCHADTRQRTARTHRRGGTIDRQHTYAGRIRMRTRLGVRCYRSRVYADVARSRMRNGRSMSAASPFIDASRTGAHE
jgi:hypothetical protein